MKKYLLILILLFAAFTTLGCQMGGSSSGGEDPGGSNLPPSEIEVFNPNTNVEMHKVLFKYDELTEKEYSYIYIGYYPQSEVKDPTYIKELNKITETNERGYIEYNGYEFIKYTVVYNHIYASGDQVGDNIFYSGTGYMPGKTHYFVVEPVAWKIIKQNEETNQMVIQTERIIDSRAFNEITEVRYINGQKVYPTNYEHSTIREWLNEDFFNLCFTEEERAMIQVTLNDNEPPAKWLDEDIIYNTTNDYVYLLSFEEVTSSSFGFAPNAICDTSRYATATNYANAKGLIKHVIDGKTTSIWAQRAGNEVDKICITYTGYDGLGFKDFFPDAPNLGIRPACTIILNQE